jgi:hypothetical protein
VNAWYIVEVIPFPGRERAFQAQMGRVSENLHELAAAYNRKTMHYGTVLAIVLAIGGLLGANYFLHAVSDVFLIPFVLVIGQLLGKGSTILSGPPVRTTV